MSHEPECTFLNEPKSVRGSCWCCAGIRAAYQRGREDAAETVRIAAYKLLMKNVVKGITWEQMADVAIAAARGGHK